MYIYMYKRGGANMYPHVHLHETLRRQAQTCVQISEVINVCMYAYVYTCVLRRRKSLAHALAAMCAIGSDDQPGTSLQRF